MKPFVFPIVAVTVLLFAGGLGCCYLSARKEERPFRTWFSTKPDACFVRLMLVLTVCAVGLYLYGRYRIGNAHLEALRNAVVFLWLAVIAWIDWKEKIIPNKMILAGLLFWVTLFTVEVLFGGTGFLKLLTFCAIGGGVCGGSLLVIATVSNNAVGMGDAKMMFVLGLFFGLLNTFGVIVLSMIIMAITSVILLLLKKASKKTAIPMAPFVWIGLTITIMMGM